MIYKSNITGIILAGGKSSRMGTDKGFLIYDGEPFVKHSINALKPLTSEIIIVSDHKEYDVFGLKRITDQVEDAGPVSGIYSGLKQSKTAYNLVLSCDIPRITSEVLKKLIDATDEKTEITQIESNGKTMPLVALYKKACANRFYELLQTNERRLQVAVSNFKVRTIPLNINEQQAVMNVNTKEELKQLENENNH
ncbi:molybdenum cofactor guanylyltransferase [Flavisericum labens]|uniref:molybdenum cofactor guanylyltransferase n=1 Tax=Flavisericum labens TaxID=3377112 RepID=UPI00387B3B2A